MKKLLLAVSIALMATTAKAQCLYVESILVDACNGSPCPGTAQEGENEMFLFKVGSTPLTIAYGTTGAAILTPSWPNNSFKGWQAPGAITNPLVAALNATIIKCGYIKEPVAGVLPANSQVLIVTSTNMCTAGNSFANLTDTLYILFQVAGNTAGHFANNDNTSTVTSTPTGASSVRTFGLSYTGVPSCSESVSYDRSLLVNDLGTYGGSSAQNDGSTVQYNSAGVATYVNNGCLAPYIPITVTASAPASACSNTPPTITGVISGPAVTYSWTTSGTGTLSTSTGTLSGAGTTTVTPTYSASTADAGAITFTLTASGKCSLAVVTHTVSIFINPAPNPTITSSNGANLCNGNSTLLTAGSTGTLTTTYAWNPGGATTSTLSVTPPTGTHIYTLSATNSCGTNNATYTVTVNPLPTITILNDSVCIGGTATLTASGADTYTWNTGVNGASITAANVTSNTNFTVSATNTLTTCQSTAIGHIIVRTAPTITTNSTSICEGVASTLTASGGAANSYTWSPGGPSGNNTYNVTPSSTTPIIVTGADIHGCINTNTVTINEEPVFTIANGGICPGASTTLTPVPSSSATATYSWVPLGVTTSSSAPGVAVQPTTTTTYTVISTNTSGCSYTQTVSVAVNSSLTITPPTNTLICSGVTTTLTVSGASTYAWSASVGGVVPVTPGDFSSVTVNQTGSVTYTVSGSSGSCSTNIVFNIGISPAFTVSANVSPSASVCPGSTVALVGSATPPATYTYTWSGGISDGISFNPASSQQYTLTGTDVNGCTATTTQNITVFATPTLTVNSPSVCPTNAATLTASGAQTYTWSATTGGGSVSTTTAMPTVSPQTYTVIGTDVNGCVSGVATSTVTTFATPTITISANPANATICAGSTITLTGSGVSNTWTGGITDGTAFTPASSQQYTVTGTDANGCQGTATQSVTVNALPNVSVNSPTICVGQSATLQAAGATTYTWSTLANTANITVQPNATTNYTVAGTDNNNCSNIAVGTVVVNNLPTISINASANSICAGNTVTLTANGAGTSGTYVWENNNSTNNPITDNPASTTVYTVVGTDANNCSAAPQTATITVNQQPIAQTISGNVVVCKGYLAAAVTLTAPNAGYTGYWTGPAPSTATVSSNATSASITNGGVYTLHVVNNCGQATSTFTVAADSVVAGFHANPVNGQTPLSVSYTNTSVAMAGNTLSYSWDFGNGASSINTNPTETYTLAGIYQTTLTATDNVGCKDTATVYITVKDVPTVVVIPNIFSPNGDNINEQFYITATGISNLECKIYDRWGLLLYSWSGLDGSWDGKTKGGTNCSEGTYFYIVTYTDNQGKSIIDNNFFQLVR